MWLEWWNDLNYIIDQNKLNNWEEPETLPYIIDINNPNNWEEPETLPYIINPSKHLEAKEKSNFSEKAEDIADELWINYESIDNVNNTIYKYFIVENWMFENFLEQELKIKDVTKLSNDEIKNIMNSLINSWNNMKSNWEDFTSITPNTILTLIQDIKNQYSWIVEL